MTTATPLPTPTSAATLLADNLAALGDRLHSTAELTASGFPDSPTANLAPSPIDPNPATALPLHILAPSSAAWLRSALALAVPSPVRIQPYAIVVFDAPESAVRCLSEVCLVDELARPHVHVLVSSDPAQALTDFWNDRPDVLVGTRCVAPSSATFTAARAALSHICIREAEQLQYFQRHFAGLAPRRNRAFWHRRFEEIRTGSGRPFHALILTSRFTTFLQHSARDLADALERAGHRAKVLLEPDEFSVASPASDLRTLATFDPDLIVGLNVSRSMIPAMVPQGVPMVNWIQDAIPKLFDRRVGLSMGELDFVLGHLHPDLYERFLYPRARSLYSSVTVSPTKFHDAPVDPARRDRFRCDVAYVSHQSETPEACRDRLMDALSPLDPNGVAAIIATMFQPIADAVTHSIDRHIDQTLRAVIDSSVRAVTGQPPTEHQAVWLLHAAAEPLAERIFRHRMATWAADLCRRRGWTFRLYGRGWDKHPTLSAYAAGEVEHGENLRACYQCAQVHLHVGLGGAHQRLYECALSGGLPLMLLKRSDLDWIEWHMQQSIAARRTPGSNAPGTCHTDDHPESRRYAQTLHALGLRSSAIDQDSQLRLDPAAVQFPWKRMGGVPMHEDDVWYMGDPTHTAFFDPATLEARLERALTDHSWREHARASVLERVHRSFTSDRLVSRLLEFLPASLAPRAARTA